MKKYDFVKLIKLNKNYLDNNLYLNVVGIIIETKENNVMVMFFNEFNIGDYAYIEMSTDDLELLQEKPPSGIAEFIKENVEHLNLEIKGFKPKIIESYKQVELIVEEEKYSQYGIHKGDKGCVMDDIAVEDSVFVDFSGIDEKGEYYGDCISVNIKDLKILE